MKKMFVLFLICFLAFGCAKEKDKEELSPYKKAAIALLDAAVDGDGEKVCKMLVPVILEEDYESLDECKEVNGAFKNIDKEVTYKIIDEKKLTGEDYIEWIGEAADYYGGIGKSNTSDVIRYKAELYVDKELFETVYFNVIKYNNEWLIVK